MNKTMDLLLHIGMHKTGTSSIQAFMDKNSDRLLARGILYPKTCSVFGGNHSPLCDAMVRDPRDDRWEGLPGWEAFATECRQAGARTVVVSGELFSGRLRSRDHALRIRDQFLGLFGTITVIVYLRRQDEYARSMYMEAVKHGFFNQGRLGKDFGETVRNIADHQADYLRLIRVLDEVFGRDRLRIRVFEKGQLHPGGLLDDFLETCGIAAAGLDMDSPALVNVSPGRKVITAMGLARHIYEKIFGARSGRRHRSGIMGLAHSLLAEAWPRDVKYVGYARGEARSLVERFRESNETLAREYLGRADGVLFRSERYDELPAGEPDEAPLTIRDVRLVVTALDICHDIYRHGARRPWLAGLRRRAAVAVHRARAGR